MMPRRESPINGSRSGLQTDKGKTGLEGNDDIDEKDCEEGDIKTSKVV